MTMLRGLGSLAIVIAAAALASVGCGGADEESTEATPVPRGGDAGRSSAGAGGQAGRAGGADLPGGATGSPFDDGDAGADADTGGGGAAGDDGDAGGQAGAGGLPDGTDGDDPDLGDAGAAGAGAAGAAGAEGTAGAGGSAGTTSEPVGDPTCPYARVNTPGTVLNIRSDPSTANAAIATLPDGTIVDVLEKVNGQAVNGTPVWFHLKSGGTVGYGYSTFLQCLTERPAEPPPLDGFYVPLACGSTAKITQGNNGTVSHNGNTKYAFDFGVPLNTSVKASAPGKVIHIYDKTKPGDPCYNGGGSTCSPYSNYVVVLHSDNTATTYKHLNKVNVVVGQQVARGAELGLSGTTGWSTGAHLHFARITNCGSGVCPTLALSFVEAGVPTTGTVVTSKNCGN